MRSEARLVRISIAIVRFARLINAIMAVALVCMFTATILAETQLAARLIYKYGASVDANATVLFVRGIMVLAAPALWAVDRLLNALRGILDTVAAHDPFTPMNVGRLRTIGWMLLILQLVDTLLGGATWIAGRLRIDMLDWQPSFTGWFAVIVSFVLVRVFAAGSALRDDLEGTV